MPVATRFVVLLALAIASLSALAAQPYVDLEQQLTPEQRHATGLDTLTSQQLALLNRLLREKSESVPAGTVADAAGNEAPPHRESDSPRAVPMDLEIRTIKSRLRGPVSSWEPGTEFRLENGQTWKVLKGEMTLRKPLESPEVLVVPGLAGRWFLQVDEDYPKARVYRID
ncbi:hypothetical protein DFR29_104382 [Tahibacter aquaticus]|uniref:Uncharacterized protein n=1 Tax=Tahibacter aquaticus TaxID=520092 RepID=A0A4R6Z2V6_9GAMM|nr:hypothetical protein [Tahibacter aquaticus]TDR45945.1 hypothetical protein DFR29_104382 [Tahibacter aquaticus]